MIKRKNGTSLVELIAVIVIMGIVASIGTVTTIAVIKRQKRNATINSLNSIYKSARGLLVQIDTSSYDERISFIDDDFAYISLSTMIDEGIIDGERYRAIGNEVYFCYNFHDIYVQIGNGTLSKEVPSSTGDTVVNDLNVTFSFEKDLFITA